jgi:hypothetical protein
MQLVIKRVDNEGALLHFVSGELGLVRQKEQSITREWVVGDRLNVSVAESPVFLMESLDTGERAHALLYENNRQIVDLSAEGSG